MAGPHTDPPNSRRVDRYCLDPRNQSRTTALANRLGSERPEQAPRPHTPLNGRLGRRWVNPGTSILDA
jgi:hypothetical protein